MAEIASAFVSIAPSARGFGSSLTKQVGGETRTAGSSLGKTFGKLFVLGAGVIAAAGIGDFLKGSVDEAREAQKVGAQTNAVLKSTGGIANVSAGQIGKLSTALSNKIGVDDEAIQSGANLLLTFTNVRNEAGKGNDIFNQATKTVQDMAAAFGGDAVSNSKILGKALNDPVKGVSALTRVGVTFTQGQKDQIASLVKSGDVLKAQKIILGELSKESAGSAVAQVTNADKARVAYGNLKETVGTALLPIIDQLAGIFTTKVAPAISTFVGQLQSGEGAGGRVAAVFATVGTVLGTVFTFINGNRAVTAVFIGSIVAMTVAFAAFNAVVSANPISLVIIAIAAFAAGLVYAYKNSDRFRAIVDGAFKGIKKVVSAVIGFVVPFVKNHWQLLVSIIGGPLAIIVIQVVKHFGTIKSVVGAVATFVVNSAKKYGEFVSAVISKMGQVVSFFKAFPGKIKAFLNALIGDMKRIGGEIVAGLLKGIQAGAGAVLAYAGQLAQKIKDKLKSALHINSPSKDTIPMGASVAEGLVVGMKEGTPGVEKAAKKMAEKMKAAIDKATQTLTDRRDNLQGLFDGIASGVTSNLGTNVFEGVKTAAAFVGSLLNAKSGMTKLLAAFNTLKGYGLDPGFLSQLFQSGGADLILSLAAGGQDQAATAASLFGDVNGLTADLSNRVAKNDPVSDRLDTTNSLLTQLVSATGKTAYDLAEAVNNPAKKARKRAKKR